MKTQHFLYCLAAIAVFFTTCKKDEYYEKWTGSYECECIRSSYINETGATWSDTTQDVMVDVTAKGNPILYISERDIDQPYLFIRNEVKVNSDGSFENIEGTYRPIIKGDFYKDSIHIYYHFYSPGASITISYNGKKIKNK